MNSWSSGYIFASALVLCCIVIGLTCGVSGIEGEVKLGRSPAADASIGLCAVGDIGMLVLGLLENPGDGETSGCSL